MPNNIISELKVVYACDHVLSHQRKIRLIVHHSDDEWQLMCGEGDHSQHGSSIRAIHSGHLFQEYVHLKDLMKEIDRGWLAEWDESGWKHSSHDD